MRRIVKTPSGWGLWDRNGGIRAARYSLTQMLQGAPIEADGSVREGPLVAPIDEQEVWASGVTYARSRVARTEESGGADIYERVYGAERPELFFKSTAGRVVGPDGPACIRGDSDWNVPEAELCLVLTPDGDVFGLTIGDDLSSRSLEGANPLYLPQAKVFTGSCVLGPCIVPFTDVELPLSIELEISRRGKVLFSESVSTADIVRPLEDLAAWLMRALEFPDGVFLMTGTGIVPEDHITLEDGDTVAIGIDPIGRLEHPVRRLPVGAVPDRYRV